MAVSYRLSIVNFLTVSLSVTAPLYIIHSTALIVLYIMCIQLYSTLVICLMARGVYKQAIIIFV